MKKLIFTIMLIIMAAGVMGATCNFGDTITSDCTLTTDISGSGRALIMNNDGITLDCNGHSIIGSKIKDGVFTSYEANNTVKNCVFINFTRGINGSSLSNNWTYINNTFKNMEYGIYIYNSELVSIINNTFINNTYGITFSDPDSNDAYNHSYTGNNFYKINTSAIDVYNTHYLTIKNNFINDSKVYGLRFTRTNYSLIENNIINNTNKNSIRINPKYNNFCTGINNYVENSNWSSIDMMCTDSVWYNNTMINSAHVAINIISADNTKTGNVNITVYNNTIQNGSIYINNMGDVNIYNNFINRSYTDSNTGGQECIAVTGNVTTYNITFYNNSCYNVNDWAIEDLSINSSNIYANNSLYNVNKTAYIGSSEPYSGILMMTFKNNTIINTNNIFPQVSVYDVRTAYNNKTIEIEDYNDDVYVDLNSNRGYNLSYSGLKNITIHNISLTIHGTKNSVHYYPKNSEPWALYEREGCTLPDTTTYTTSTDFCRGRYYNLSLTVGDSNLYLDGRTGEYVNNGADMFLYTSTTERNNVTLSNFTIQKYDDAILLRNDNNITVSNNIIQNSTTRGIGCTGAECEEIKIISNQLTNNSLEIYMERTLYSTVLNNTINSDGTAITFLTNSHNCTIENNVITRDDNSLGTGILTEKTSNGEFYINNNSVTGFYYGIRNKENNHDTTISNSTLMQQGLWGVVTASNNTDILDTYVYDNEWNSIYFDGYGHLIDGFYIENYLHHGVDHHNDTDQLNAGDTIIRNGYITQSSLDWQSGGSCIYLNQVKNITVTNVSCIDLFNTTLQPGEGGRGYTVEGNLTENVNIINNTLRNIPGDCFRIGAKNTIIENNTVGCTGRDYTLRSLTKHRPTLPIVNATIKNNIYTSGTMQMLITNFDDSIINITINESSSIGHKINLSNGDIVRWYGNGRKYGQIENTSFRGLIVPTEKICQEEGTANRKISVEIADDFVIPSCAGVSNVTGPTLEWPYNGIAIQGETQLNYSSVAPGAETITYHVYNTTDLENISILNVTTNDFQAHTPADGINYWQVSSCISNGELCSGSDMYYFYNTTNLTETEFNPDDVEIYIQDDYTDENDTSFYVIMFELNNSEYIVPVNYLNFTNTDTLIAEIETGYRTMNEEINKRWR